MKCACLIGAFALLLSAPARGDEPPWVKKTYTYKTSGDIQIGVWDSITRTLAVGNVGATGVRVTARRDGGANGPVATWLAGMMGINNMNVVATATAADTR